MRKISFSLILILSALIINDELARAEPVIQGVYTGSYTTAVSNCTDTSSNGTYNADLVINITSQTGSSFIGTATGTINIENSTVKPGDESMPSSEVSATPSEPVSTTVINTLPANCSLATDSLAQGGTFVASGTKLEEFTLSVTANNVSVVRPIVLGTTDSGEPTLGPILWEGQDINTPFSGEITFYPDLPITIGTRYFIGLDNGFLTSVQGNAVLIGCRNDNPILDGHAWRAFSYGWNPFSPGVDIAARIVMTSSEAQPPGAPQNVMAEADDSQVAISWEAVIGADSYNIYWNTNGNVTTSDRMISVVTSPYVHAALTKGTTYYYMVTAVNDTGESPPSMEVEAYLTKYWKITGMLDETAGSIVVIGNRAYLAGCHYLKIVDITDSTNPFMIEEVRISNSCRQEDGLAVVGNAAYVPFWESSTNTSGIKVVELREIGISRIVGSVEIPADVRQISVTGNTAYIVDDDGNLSMLDVSEPLNPQLIDTVAGPGFGFTCISVEDNIAYAGGDDYTFRTLNLSDPENPVVVGQLSFLDYSWINDLFLDGSTVYLATSQGLKIIDVSNISNPLLESYYDVDYGRALTVSDEMVFLADLNAGLHMIDASNITLPDFNDFIAVPPQTTDVSVSNMTAYVVGNGGFFIIDLKKEDLVFDFGTNIGIWARYNDSVWAKLHSQNPEIIAIGDLDGNGEDDCIIDFGSGLGIWVYYNNTGWSRLHSLSAEIIVTGDLDSNGRDECIIDFGSGVGIWILYNNATWIKLHNNSPEIITTGDLDGNGEVDCVMDFGSGIGVYVFYNSTGWTKLHSLSPEIMTVGDLDGNGQDDCIIDFGSGIGIWVWLNNTTWVKLHSLSPEIITTGDLDGNGQDDCIIDFGSGIGIWVRYNNTTWTKLHSLSPESITTGDLDGKGEDDCIIDFGAGVGIYAWYNNATWTKLHSLSPESIHKGNIVNN